MPDALLDNARTFWSANVKRSYKLATDHASLVSFVAPVFTTIVAGAGMSLFTTSKVLTALGAGLGPLIWFAFLMLFVTPSRMWRELQAANAAINGDSAARKLPDRLRQLSDEILQFAAERDRFPIGKGGMLKSHELGPAWAIEEALQESLEASQERHAETINLYSRMFADRVIAARDEIRLMRPTERIDSYALPSGTGEMAAVAEWLAGVAGRLTCRM
jgi:hypothetical protein